MSGVSMDMFYQRERIKRNAVCMYDVVCGFRSCPILKTCFSITVINIWNLLKDEVYVVFMDVRVNMA